MSNPDDDFATLFEQSMAKGSADAAPSGTKRLQAGQVVRGTVIAIADDTIFVDVGTKAEARLDRSAVLDAKGELTVAVGDTIEATVAHAGGREPPRLVRAFSGSGVTTQALELAMAAGTPVEGEVAKAVKAGLEVEIGGVRAFCPASQVEMSYVADLETFVGQRHFFRVIEVRDGGRSVVVSRKALLLAEREAKAADLVGRLQEGAELDGIVQTIQPYGVFVDLGGVQGLVHVSEMAHSRVANPSDLVSVGESVRVKVVSVAQAASGKPRDTRISLSMKALVQPTEQDQAASTTDETITATVVKVEGYGIVVDTPAGQGLVPNAELALPPGSDPRRAYSPGDTLEVVLQRRDSGSGRLRFSAKAVEEAEARRNYRQFRDGQGGKGRGLGSLGDLLQGLELPSTPAKPEAAQAQPGRPAQAVAPSSRAQAPGHEAAEPRKGKRRRV